MADYPRVLACKAHPGYRLWLRFYDGMQGTVDCSALLDIGCFKFWRDVHNWENVRADPQRGTAIWDCGVRLDPEVLYADLKQSGCKRVKPPEQDHAFQRFLQAALAPVKRKSRKGTRTPGRGRDFPQAETNRRTP